MNMDALRASATISTLSVPSGLYMTGDIDGADAATKAHFIPESDHSIDAERLITAHLASRRQNERNLRYQVLGINLVRLTNAHRIECSSTPAGCEVPFRKPARIKDDFLSVSLIVEGDANGGGCSF
jgi:hypothetical protein